MKRPTASRSHGKTIAGRKAIRWRCAMAAALALVTAALLVWGATPLAFADTALAAGQSARELLQAALTGAASSSAARVNAAGKPPLTPSTASIAKHEVYFESPPRPRGLLFILHKCGRSASDHWPRSAACPTCLGLPQSVAKTKQALSRGYAVAAMSSLDRSTGGGGRCFAWADDAAAAAEALRSLRTRLRLPPGARVFVNGASSGGSLGLRLPSIASFNGAVGEVIAPPGMRELLDRMEAAGKFRMPPALYIHMPLDAGMAAKVTDNMAALRDKRVPAAQVKVAPRPLARTFFSDMSPAISLRLSASLFSRIRDLGLLDGAGFVKVDPGNVVWNAFRSLVSSPTSLGQLLVRLKSAGQREQDPRLVAMHIWECINVAWARHETIGEYMTAALLWLESNGTASMAHLAQQHRVPRLSALAVDTTGAAWQPRR